MMSQVGGCTRVFGWMDIFLAGTFTYSLKLIMFHFFIFIFSGSFPAVRICLFV